MKKVDKTSGRGRQQGRRALWGAALTLALCGCTEVPENCGNDYIFEDGRCLTRSEWVDTHSPGGTTTDTTGTTQTDTGTTTSDGSAEVRFTWEAHLQSYILDIIAGYDDVKYWKEYVFAAYNYVLSDATDYPLYNGIYDIRDKIYSSRQPQYATRYKGVYLPVSAGNYTAVCTVEDRYSIFDIVANYKIRAGGVGSVNYYEVAFDVRSIISGWDDYGWDFGDYGEYPHYDDYILQKKPAAGLVKKVEQGAVTYYVFRRP